MFNFDLRIANPFSNRFEILRSSNGRICDHKAWESNFYRTNTIFNLSIDITPRRDHAGMNMFFGAFGFEYEFSFYDTRHWDTNTNSWV